MTRLAYFEWSAPDDADLDDPDAWAQANPALGIRITPEFIKGERAALFMASGSDDDWIRERLGIFPEDIDATEAVIDEGDWKACQDTKSKLVGAPVFVFEVSTDRKWSVITAVGASSKGGTHVEVIEHRQRTGWVPQRLVELRDKRSPEAIACDPSGPAGGLLAECERLGLTITEVKGADRTQACQAAYDDITEHRWRHIGQPSLTAAVTGAGKRIQGDAWVFDRRGLLDIAPLTAVTLGAWIRRPQAPKKRVAFL